MLTRLPSRYMYLLVGTQATVELSLAICFPYPMCRDSHTDSFTASLEDENLVRIEVHRGML